MPDETARSNCGSVTRIFETLLAICAVSLNSIVTKLSLALPGESGDCRGDCGGDGVGDCGGDCGHGRSGGTQASTFVGTIATKLWANHWTSIVPLKPAHPSQSTNPSNHKQPQATNVPQRCPQERTVPWVVERESLLIMVDHNANQSLLSFVGKTKQSVIKRVEKRS